MASLTELTPQERLAISRKAIVRHMNRHHPRIDQDVDGSTDEEEFEATTHAHNSTLDRLKYAARVWWHRHPASAAVELANPLLSSYARVHPFKLLGVAAASGAVIALVRPWRMVSASTVLVAAVKSSGVTNTLLSMLSSLTRHPDSTDI